MVKTRHCDALAMPQTGGDGVIAEAFGIVCLSVCPKSS
jgi:hypothetical protein